MLTSLAEGLIQRACGRFLKNFNHRNISLGVTGSITLSDIELNVAEFQAFSMPVTPIRAFIGSLYADLPIILGGPFDIRVSDILFIFDRNPGSFDTNSAVLLNKAIQLWIGTVFLSMTQQMVAEGAQISSGEIEYMQKMADRLMISVHRLHIRLEDKIYPSDNNSRWISGMLIDSCTLRNMTKEDVLNVPEMASQLNQAAAVSKLLQVSNLSVYCTRSEESHVDITDAMFNRKFVESMYHPRKDCLLSPWNLTGLLSLVYQRNNLIFGPAIVRLNFSEIHVNISDEQLLYIISISHHMESHFSELKLLSRRLQISSCLESSRRARMRWFYLRDCLKQDWNRFAVALPGGATRWRAWFADWRIAARYVVLRELLLYHTGFEAIYDSTGELMSYSLAECLVMDHHNRDLAALKAAEAASSDGMTRKQKRRYQCVGQLTEAAVEAAEALLRQAINTCTSAKPYLAALNAHDNGEGSKSPDADDQFDMLPSDFNPVHLSPVMVRALYSLQLEMDAILPVRMAAQCRIWAEEKYRMKVAIGQSNAENYFASNPENGDEPSDPSGSSMLVAVLDANYLFPSFGMSSVDALVTLKPVNWSTPIKSLSTQVKSSKLISQSSFGRVSWGEVFTVPITDEQYNADQAYLAIDCDGKGVFAPSFGRGSLPLNAILHKASPTSSSTLEGVVPDPQSVAIDSHTIKLVTSNSMPSGVASPKNSEEKKEASAISSMFSVFSGVDPSSAAQPILSPSLRIMTMVATGDSAFRSRCLDRLREKMTESIAAQTLIWQKEEQLQARAASNSSDADENLVLDPSMLTLQDCQISLHLPRIRISFCTEYLLPQEITSLSQQIQSSVTIERTAPLVQFDVHQILAKVRFSNNPWQGSGSLEIGRVTLALKSIEPDSASSSKLAQKTEESILSLPKIVVEVSASQTSTMSQFLDGKLDLGCFDWTTKLSLFPFVLSFSPKHGFQGPTPDEKLIWRNFRPLSHLYLDRALWSFGLAPMGCVASGYHLSGEARILLGDGYELYPQSANVIREFLARKVHVYSELDLPFKIGSSTTSSISEILMAIANWGSKEEIRATLDQLERKLPNQWSKWRSSTTTTNCFFEILTKPKHVKVSSSGSDWGSLKYESDDDDDDWDEVIGMMEDTDEDDGSIGVGVPAEAHHSRQRQQNQMPDQVMPSSMGGMFDWMSFSSSASQRTEAIVAVNKSNETVTKSSSSTVEATMNRRRRRFSRRGSRILAQENAMLLARLTLLEEKNSELQRELDIMRSKR